MKNYAYFYKHQFHSLDDDRLGEKEYDFFISSFADTERVLCLASVLRYKDSLWLVDVGNAQNLFIANQSRLIIKPNEDYYLIISHLRNLSLKGKSICIDATGFKTPYLLFLIRTLYELKIEEFDIYYTEPQKYKFADETEFSDQFFNVRGITGLVGQNTSVTDRDLMIIAAGYDHSRIIDVANSKKSADKVLLFGFPALSPSMFQENVIRAYRAESSVKDTFQNIDTNIFAPAYDPFITAQSIHDYIEQKRSILRKVMGNQNADFSNIYLAPLSSKPQAIGMALYFMWERGWTKNITILYPLCNTYHTDISSGVTHIWRYQIQLPRLSE